MFDIMLNHDGDLRVSTKGDISLTYSIRQAILVRLRWILNEWRLGPEYGFPWFEEVFVKNPNTDRIRQLIRDTILEIPDVKTATVGLVKYDRQKRSIRFSYTATVSEETFTEEVTLYV